MIGVFRERQDTRYSVIIARAYGSVSDYHLASSANECSNLLYRLESLSEVIVHLQHLVDEVEMVSGINYQSVKERKEALLGGQRKLDILTVPVVLPGVGPASGKRANISLDEVEQFTVRLAIDAQPVLSEFKLK